MTEQPAASYSVAEMFEDAVNSYSRTETILEQSKYKCLTGLWAIRSDFEQDSDKACDFFIGAIMGMAMIAAKAEYEERERILSTNTYYASEFAGLDDDGNFVDPPAKQFKPEPPMDLPF